ncbi:HAMP domain-containing histidine kinase [Nocardioides sp. WL0053]|uniref:histidine kinase n=1 Tax=Nocardioides jiangsuensis TaxID=2866161 RepID=A0ABS7RKA3_9ACTN|nr:HAMP domain-containing sensor histidine kinase [Nocardioides jiangsuensis]MBY9075485.1 HAMP domain-containing histidine kinase [Nocardioides jiangsuensis]
MRPHLPRSASFRTQIVLGTAALMAALMIVVGLGTQLVLELTARSDIHHVLVARANAVAASVRAASDTSLIVPAAAVEPGVQVFGPAGTVLAGSVEQRAADDARELALRGETSEVDAGGGVRLRAVPFTTSSGDRGVVVASVLTTPYERSERYALLATVVLGLIVVGMAALLARRVTDQALVPVSQMATRAADWSEHDLAQRFDLGPPTNELAVLGETLDHLLERVARAIRSEQRLTSELAHELRTPLTAIQGSADLALMRGVDDPELRLELEQIAASTRTMAATIAALLDLARENPEGLDRDSSLVSDLVGPLRALVPDHLRFVDTTGDTGTVALATPGPLALRALAPLIENACAHATSEVSLSARREGHQVALSVTDDGVGIDAALQERLFEPGATAGAGTGLGLGIARRTARSLGGDVVVEPAERTTFTVRLPVA